MMSEHDRILRELAEEIVVDEAKKASVGLRRSGPISTPKSTS
ncbi:hypothetical protein AB0F43_31140 [Kribbella sp. NPDC023972]